MASQKGNYYISSLVRKLDSSSASSVQKSLISLTRATKKSENVAKLREEGGIKTLLQFIQRSNRKIVDLSVSVLANCALEKECRVEIKHLDGLKYLKNILNSLNETSILSRVTRSIANLSLDNATAQQVVDLDVVPIFVKLLSETTDLHLKQNIIRALRIIGKTDDGKKEVVDCNGLQLIIELLRSESKDIRTACVQNLQELSKTGDRLVAEQIQEHCAIEPIIEMTHSDDKNLRTNAILTLSNITANASVRVSVGTIGGIEAFIYQIQKRSAQDLVLASIEGVCMCCREAVNRNKVRTCGGLEVLMGIFRSPEYSQAYDRILSAFVCFVYDELALNRLLANGIIPALIAYLQQLLGTLAGRGVEDKVISGQRETQTTTSATSCVSPVKPRVISKKSSMTSEVLFKSEQEPSNSRESRSETMFHEPISDYPTLVNVNVFHTSALSPASSLSPSCSPEHHLSYISPLHLQSARDGAFSPTVYSPCGSEGDNDSEESPGDEDELFQKQDRSNSAGSNEGCQNSVSFSENKDSQGAALASENMDSQNSVSFSENKDSQNSVSFSENMDSQNSVSFSESMDSQSRVSASENKDAHNESARYSKDTTECSGETQARDQQDYVNENAVKPSPCPFEISTPHSATPLLPGASLSDHFHMFLPKENLFSADLPSPKKSENPIVSKTCRVRRSLTQDTPSTARPGYTPCSPVSSSSRSSGQRDDPEKNILFLLSRFAHMPNPPEELVALSCMETLMDYLSYSLNPDQRCARLLNSLTWNVNCFEVLVLNMSPGAFYRQLGCGFGPGYHLGSTALEANLEVSVVNDQESRRISTPENDRLGKSANQNPSTPEEDKETGAAAEVSCTNSDTKSISTFQVCSDATLEPSSLPSNTKSRKRCIKEVALQEDEKIDGVRCSPSRMKNIEQLLLSNMSTQACTSFGKGQLAHLLLRGSAKQKRACALSLPYLCRVKSLKRKLLLEYNGIVMILSALSDPEDEYDVVRAVESLTYLVSNSSLRLPKPVPLCLLFIGKTEDDFSKTVADQVNAVEVPRKRRKIEVSCRDQANTTGCHDTANTSTSCRYSESTTAPFDVLFKLDGGESIEAHRSVLSAFSEVFSAMLSNDYMEAKQLEVIVKDIDHDILLFLVHYAYGCQRPYLDEEDANPTVCALFEKCVPSEHSLANFDFFFDLLVCADRFLLDDLKYQCQQLLMHCVNKQRAVDAYLCGACYNASVLRDFSLKYIFVGNLDLRCVYNCTRRLLATEERSCVLEDLKRVAFSCI